MKLNSEDIQRQEFGVKLFGFDKDEVRIFLKVVATEYEELINEVEALKKELKDKGAQIQSFNETRGEVREILEIVRQSDRGVAAAADNSNVIERRMVKIEEGITQAVNRIREDMAAPVRGRESGSATKDDIKVFLSTIEQIKKEEMERAEREAEQVIKEAEQQRDEMIRTKEQQADEMVRNAEAEVEKMKKEVSDLKGQYKSFEERMKGLIQSQLNILGSIEEDKEADSSNNASVQQSVQQEARSPFVTPKS